ncbi:MAG: DUF3810 domain-containing protein [Oscillospiraceae bacterium]|nr:DUF3810 domain-containing protein [Oscillospiraceae bacterium]
MENKTVKKRGFAAIYKLCPAAHTVGLISLAVILLHLALRHNHALMVRLSDNVVQPIHHALAHFNSAVSFSVAELLIVCAVLFVLAELVLGVVLLLRRKMSGKRLYVGCVRIVSLVLLVYAGFCALWGTYYYGDDFAQKSGLSNEPVSVEELETVTAYFAALANEYGAQVERNDDWFYVADREDILRRSTGLFDATVADFPNLDGPRVAVKPIYFSRFLSYLDFTGFFFPFTGEANVNTDFPPSLFASTVAHELSHQRGVAKEQEANFTAVLTSLNNGDVDYCYSAALLAYTHLGNALYSTDYESWQAVYETLDEGVLRDFALNNAYWRQFETPAQSVSHGVYEAFLQSYEQTLGRKSYGACVDLLVNYYYETAAETLSTGG